MGGSAGNIQSFSLPFSLTGRRAQVDDHQPSQIPGGLVRPREVIKESESRLQPTCWSSRGSGFVFPEFLPLFIMFSFPTLLNWNTTSSCMLGAGVQCAQLCADTSCGCWLLFYFVKWSEARAFQWLFSRGNGLSVWYALKSISCPTKDNCHALKRGAVYQAAFVSYRVWGFGPVFFLYPF